MAKKENIITVISQKWDDYKEKSPEVSLSEIYNQLSTKARQICDWYWISIRGKKTMSLVARGLAIALLITGTILPIYSASEEDPYTRLILTQTGVALLVVAGLITLADRVFGWSTGWMRYIYTVTTMENLTSAYQLEWARHLAINTDPINRDDVKFLFDLSITLEQELLKLQAEETTKWIAEFNTSISLLESMIKTQREETEKKIDLIRTSLAKQVDAAKEDEKLNAPGAIELSFSYSGQPVSLNISRNGKSSVAFFGNSWAEINVEPGQHLISIEVTSDPPRVINKAIDVQPGKVASAQITIG